MFFCYTNISSRHNFSQPLNIIGNPSKGNNNRSFAGGLNNLLNRTGGGFKKQSHVLYANRLGMRQRPVFLHVCAKALGAKAFYCAINKNSAVVPHNFIKQSMVSPFAAVGSSPLLFTILQISF